MHKNNQMEKEELLVSQINESSTHPLVIVFSAKWHSHSDIVEIITEKIAKADDSINLFMLDADKDEEFFIRYKIGTIPSALIIKDRKMIKKIEGTFSKKTILDIVHSA